MIINVKRDKPSPLSTQGSMYVNGVWFCYTLEPPNPMPAGTYDIIIYNSPHFQFDVMRLLDVPGHDFIEIHPGNWPKDTHDCILPGYDKGQDAVYRSDVAFETLRKAVKAALSSGQSVQICVEDITSVLAAQPHADPAGPTPGQ